jgi:hypothetical protein
VKNEIYARGREGQAVDLNVAFRDGFTVQRYAEARSQASKAAALIDGQSTVDRSVWGQVSQRLTTSAASSPGALRRGWICGSPGRPARPIPGRRVLIITYGCTVPTPDRAPVLSHEHKQIGLFSAEEAAQQAMPEGYQVTSLTVVGCR